MFSVAANKLTEKLTILLEKFTKKEKLNEADDTHTPSNLDSSFSSINANSFLNNSLVKGSKTSLNSP
jgi:hypothetical protein